MPTRPDTLLVGCGDLGSRIGLRLAQQGRTVLALRRRADRVPPPLLAQSVDLTKEIPELPTSGPGESNTAWNVVVALTADARNAEAYRGIYLDGLDRALTGLHRTQAPTEHAVFVSSTAACAGEGDVTEETPSRPGSPTGAVLLEAEQLFRERIPQGTVIRLGGLYGPDRSWLTDAVRAQRWGRQRWTNTIHRHDAADAVVHLLGLKDPDPLYLGVDEEPAPAWQAMSYIAERLGLPGPPATDICETVSGKRVIGNRLRATGFEFTYPTYREGHDNCAEHRPARG